MSEDLVAVVIRYIDRMGDPIETVEYMSKLLESFSNEVYPVLEEIMDQREQEIGL